MASTKRRYEQRIDLLEKLASALQADLKDQLKGYSHIDQISARAKGVNSFVAKADDAKNGYLAPLEEIEDQVGGRVLVFFRSTMDRVKERLLANFSVVEQSRRRPRPDAEFGYESDHYIVEIRPDLCPAGWSEQTEMPRMMELQVRTLFMHAWAEPQHDLAYKSKEELTSDQARRLAWVAASAWGADRFLDEVAQERPALARGAEPKK